MYLLHVRKKLSTESATAHARLKICFLQQYCGDKAEVADYLEGLGIDKDMQVVGMVGMGYPDEEREAAKRQDDLVTYLN